MSSQWPLSYSINSGILCNLNVHHRVHNSPPQCPHSEPEKNHSTFSFCILKIHFNSVLPCRPRCDKWTPSLRFPHKFLVRTYSLPHTCHMSLPPRFSCSDTPNILQGTLKYIINDRSWGIIGRDTKTADHIPFKY